MNSCPQCHITWDSANTIPEDLFAGGGYATVDKAKEAAECYGWNENNSDTKRFKVNCVYVTMYSEDYSSKDKYWECTNCEYKQR